MTSISNIKIGKKIALILGGMVFLVAGLAAFALWGVDKNDQLAVTLSQRLTKARLAEQIEGDTSSIARSLAQMIIEKKRGEIYNSLVERRKERVQALDEFRKLADTPTSIKHGTDMTDLAQKMVQANEGALAAIDSGRFADAIKQFQTASSVTNEMTAKAKEAAHFQESRADEVSKTRAETSTAIREELIAGGLIAVALAVIAGLVLTRGIAVPIAAVVSSLEHISQGDLSKDAPSEYQIRGDEIGVLARGLQATIVSLRKMIQEVTGGIQVLASSSTELMASSTEMTSGSRQASDKSHSVSAAAEEMSSNITSVAAGMEQTTTNLAHVAAATDQMTSTIGEIARNSENARRITDEATRQAAKITQQINELGAAAREIGKVTEAITEISSQTNLLALNATIEAARAGTAGKGFAVVATEIKALAQQTATATEDIKGRIAGVQSATAGGIAEIGKVSQVIAEVSAIVASIAAAIEEQATATKHIARNIAEASAGVNDANTRVAETSVVSREIARDIVSVDQAAGEIATGSGHVRTSAGELSAVAESLRVTVARFRA